MPRRLSDHHSTQGDNPSYSLDELTSLADVTTRTIRYYIAEGLLPPPDSVGRHASYTQEHLDRLRLIARLKDDYLPLREIRRRLTSMSPEDIRDSAGTVEADNALQMSASRYISHVLAEDSDAAWRGSVRPPASAPRTAIPIPDPNDEPWRRIRITNEAELLITDTAHRRRSDQLDATIDWIRRILNES